MEESLKTERFETSFEEQVVGALESRPKVAVPDDFAARVMHSLPAKALARAEIRPVFGQAAGYLAVAAMTIVLGVLAWMYPEAFKAGRGFLFTVELLLVGQLLAVGLWLGIRSGG